MRGKPSNSELVSVSQWFNGRSPVHKTGDLRFKFWLRHKFLSQNLSGKENLERCMIINMIGETEQHLPRQLVSVIRPAGHIEMK